MELIAWTYPSSVLFAYVITDPDGMTLPFTGTVAEVGNAAVEEEESEHTTYTGEAVMFVMMIRDEFLSAGVSVT